MRRLLTLAMDLRNQRVLVTGGAIRVGRAIALRLAEAGAQVCIHYGRSADAAASTLSELEALGSRAAAISADLSDAEATACLIGRASDALGGPIDVLINSAAIFLPGDLAATDLAMWESQFGINLRAPFQLSQSFAAQVGSAEPAGGAIINILDARNNRPGADHFAYRLTKVALEAMTRNLAVDLAPAIRVNAVALGAILAPPGEDASYLEALAQTRVPLRRPGSPELVADNVLHLLQQDFLTGVVIPLDGGEFL